MAKHEDRRSTVRPTHVQPPPRSFPDLEKFATLKHAGKIPGDGPAPERGATLTSRGARRFGKPRRDELTPEQEARYGAAFRDAARGWGDRAVLDLPGLQAAFLTLGFGDVLPEDIECRPRPADTPLGLLCQL